jgi:hypothetical protein
MVGTMTCLFWLLFVLLAGAGRAWMLAWPD